MSCVLTIAGSDSSGGAGIQADIKTISAFGLYAASAITALTAQNTTGVFGVCETDPDFIAAQINAVFNDIPPRAVKVGMAPNAEAIISIAERLAYYQAANIVVDPVMVATSGAKLISESAQQTLVEQLFSAATIITPNMAEAATLSGIAVDDEAGMLAAARILTETTDAAILVKGGHLAHEATDLLLVDCKEIWLADTRIDTDNTHGTGCTLSSAIACGLAQGLPIEASVRAGKNYVRRAMSTGLNLGHGNGPLNHLA